MSISNYRIPPPRKLKFRQILGLWVFSITEYPPSLLKFRQILGLWVFSITEYPPNFIFNYWYPPSPPLPDLPNGKLCVVSYHMWRLYPTRITTRLNVLTTNQPRTLSVKWRFVRCVISCLVTQSTNLKWLRLVCLLAQFRKFQNTPAQGLEIDFCVWKSLLHIYINSPLINEHEIILL